MTFATENQENATKHKLPPSYCFRDIINSKFENLHITSVLPDESITVDFKLLFNIALGNARYLMFSDGRCAMSQEDK